MPILSHQAFLKITDKGFCWTEGGYWELIPQYHAGQLINWIGNAGIHNRSLTTVQRTRSDAAAVIFWWLLITQRKMFKNLTFLLAASLFFVFGFFFVTTFALYDEMKRGKEISEITQKKSKLVGSLIISCGCMWGLALLVYDYLTSFFKKI